MDKPVPVLTPGEGAPSDPLEACNKSRVLVEFANLELGDPYPRYVAGAAVPFGTTQNLSPGGALWPRL
jgi:hypothetical protein